MKPEVRETCPGPYNLLVAELIFKIQSLVAGSHFLTGYSAFQTLTPEGEAPTGALVLLDDGLQNPRFPHLAINAPRSALSAHIQLFFLLLLGRRADKLILTKAEMTART